MPWQVSYSACGAFGIYKGSCIGQNRSMSEADFKRRLLAGRRVAAKGYVGVTTFISKTLMCGKRWVPPRSGVIAKPKKRGAGRKVDLKRRGLYLGRRLDVALRRYIEDGVRAPQLSMVIARLERLDVRLVASQFRVAHPRLKIKTELDAVGYVVQGACLVPVVIELKNTQMTVAQHSDSYREPSPTNRYLSNGLLNSEKERHHLQAGFGCLGLKLATGMCGYGLVVVNCSDGCVAYKVDAGKYGAASLFA